MQNGQRPEKIKDEAFTRENEEDSEEVMLNNPEDLDDDRKELGKANKSLKIREAKLATISSKYKWYRKGLKSAIQNLEH